MESGLEPGVEAAINLRETEQVCQLADRGTDRSNLCRHGKVSDLLEGHICVWCLCTRHVTLQ